MILLALFAVAFLCWFLSSVAAGGGAVLLLPAARFALEPQDIPPVIATASVLSSVQRTFLYRSSVSWPIWRANVPGLVAGSLVGAALLRGLSAEALGVVVGVLLVGLALRHFTGGSLRLEGVRPRHFALASFVTAGLSSVAGAAGPLMNPLYVGAGVVKESMLGTKAASTFFMQLSKLVSYALLGLMSREVLVAASFVAAGAIGGNLLGRRVLGSLDPGAFVHYVYGALLVSGLAILYRALVAPG